MHLVCSECHLHANQWILTCPQCGSELEEITSMRVTRPGSKARREFKTRRDPKRILNPRRRMWAETEAREL